MPEKPAKAGKRKRPWQDAGASSPAEPAGKQPGWRSNYNSDRWRVSPKAAELGLQGGFEGKLASDGSMLDGRPRSARRAGFSVVAFDEKGMVLQVLFGPAPLLQPSAF